MKAESSLEEMLPIVNQAVDCVLRRRRQNRDFGDDFRGFVMLKVLEREGAILKQFRGESTLLTYLRVVVDRLYCDYLISLNGKWHPSKKAAELGTKAAQLERFVYHDGFTLNQAIGMMRAQDGRVSESDLRALFAEIPTRHTRYFVELGSVAELHVDPRFSADAILKQKEIEEAGKRIRESLASALNELPDEDRQILDLRFAQGLRISRIGFQLGLRQRSLYGRISRILRVLKRKLEARGIGRSCMAEIQGSFGSPCIDGLLSGGWARCASKVTSVTVHFEFDQRCVTHAVKSQHRAEPVVDATLEHLGLARKEPEARGPERGNLKQRRGPQELVDAAASVDELNGVLQQAGRALACQVGT